MSDDVQIPGAPSRSALSNEVGSADLQSSGDDLDLNPDLQALRTFTAARVALARTGTSIATQDHLRFQHDHALARDAVHAALDIPTLLDALRQRNWNPITLYSAAPDRRTYLRRPDLGRRLSPESVTLLQATTQGAPPSTTASSSIRVGSNSANLPDVSSLAIILADGLSSLAIERNAIPLLDALALPIATPICVATQARVALGDEIGELLGAQIAIVLIGERPGLSAADSLGVYITWAPRPGRTDAERICISNIREGGLTAAEAALRIHAALASARQLGATGVALGQPTLREEEDALRQLDAP